MKITWVLAGLLLLVFMNMGCRKEESRVSLPSDGIPTIRRTAPVQASAVANTGGTVGLRFTMADNEELLRWNMTETIVQNLRMVDTNIIVNGKFRDTTLLKADTVRKAQEIYLQALKGNVSEISYNYRVPFGIQPFQRVLLQATVSDIKKQTASELFVITIDVPDKDTLRNFFTILDYSQLAPDTIYNGVAGNFKSAFNLIAREHVFTNNPAAKDIEEITTNLGEFKMQFSSPASAPDSALVIISSADFNFDQLTYATMWQAYYTRRALKQTPVLKAGDIVIVKLMLRHQSLVQFSHFAAIRIEQIVNVGGGQDYITFRYKRSQDF